VVETRSHLYLSGNKFENAASGNNATVFSSIWSFLVSRPLLFFCVIVGHSLIPHFDFDIGTTKQLSMRAGLFLILFGLLVVASKVESQETAAASVPFYTPEDDASWAVVSSKLSTMLGEHPQVIYDKYISDCEEAVKSINKEAQNCAEEEKHRFLMNRQQPKSVYNYTKVGYTKIKAPKELFDLILDFYETNKGKDRTEWANINTYHNMWEVPPTIMHLNQQKNQGGGASLQTTIWNTAKPLMEEWTGQELSPVSLYGIRVYHGGSILAPHVDRMPLVTSAISKFSYFVGNLKTSQM
jgi:hypothetical protein